MTLPNKEKLYLLLNTLISSKYNNRNNILEFLIYLNNVVSFFENYKKNTLQILAIEKIKEKSSVIKNNIDNSFDTSKILRSIKRELNILYQ